MDMSYVDYLLGFLTALIAMPIMIKIKNYQKNKQKPVQKDDTSD